MKEKLFFLVPGLIIIVILSVIIVQASIDENLIEDGDFVYSLNEDGESYSIGLSSKSVDFGAELVLPSSFKDKPVTKIRENGFSYCGGISKIVIPDSVKVIDYQAFKDCASLKEVVFADTAVIESIGNSAFHNCDSLLQIKLPQGLKNISYNLFYECDSLVSVELPEGVEKILSGAFAYCIKLEGMNVPASVKDISDNAYFSCHSLSYVNFTSEGATETSSLRRIGRAAFYNCKKLSDVIFPKKLKNIGTSAFAYCSELEEVSFTGSSLQEIGSSAFVGCNALNKVDVADIANWCGVSFSGNDYSNPIYLAQRLYNNGELVLRLEIPYGVKTISARAFKNATRIVSVTLPRDFDYDSGSIGTDAFRFCYKLVEIHNFSKLQVSSEMVSLTSTGYISAYAQHIYYWGSNSYPQTSDMYPYGEAGKIYPQSESVKWNTRIYTYGEKDEYIFYKDGSVHYLLEYLGTDANIALPSTEQSYGIFTGAFFGQTGIESIVVPDCVDEIWHFAFYSSSDLKRIYIPNSVVSMGDRLFGKTDGLEIYFEATDHIVGWKDSYMDAATDVNIYYSQNKETLPWVQDLIKE